MKETKLVVFTEEKYMDNKPVVQLVHSTDYGIKTLRLWIDGVMTIGEDTVQDDERDVYLNHFGSNAARDRAIDIWNKAMDSINKENEMKEYKITRASHAIVKTIKTKMKKVRVLDEVVTMKYDNRTVILTMLGHPRNNKEIFSSTISGDTKYYKTDEFIFGEPVEVNYENGRALYETPITGVKSPEPTRTLEDAEAELVQCKKIIRIMKEIIDKA